MAEYKEVEWHIDSALVIFLTVRDIDLDPADISLLTSDDIRWGLATSPGGDPVVTLNIGGGISIEDGPLGAIKITLDESDQDDLRPGQYYHECKVALDSGNHTQLYGPAVCRESIFEVTT
jgi:hypothetical protein